MQKGTIGKVSSFSNGFCQHRFKHMALYGKFEKDCGNGGFELKINKDIKKLEYQDLTGPEKIMLFQHKFPGTT